jgi:hypothetical protein
MTTELSIASANDQFVDDVNETRRRRSECRHAEPSFPDSPTRFGQNAGRGARAHVWTLATTCAGRRT